MDQISQINRRHFLTTSAALGMVSGLATPGCTKNTTAFCSTITHDDFVMAKRHAASPFPIQNFTPHIATPVSYEKALPDFRNAYICARLSHLTRKEAVEAQHTDQKYKIAVERTLKNWGFRSNNQPVVINSRAESGCRKPGTQGIIAYHNSMAIIAFRSTETKLNDWLKNIDTLKTSNPYGDGKVHTGFLKAFINAQCIIDRELPTLKSMDSIWLTGHSLGAAISVLASRYLKQNGLNNVSGLYTFGSPRIGDDRFRREINSDMKHTYWRFVNGSDIVHDLPQSAFIPFFPGTNFHREGSVIQLNNAGFEVLRRVDSNGRWHRCRNFHGYRAGDHSIQHYQKNLKRQINLRFDDFPDMPIDIAMGVDEIENLNTTADEIKLLQEYENNKPRNN